jgi:hypothetical protein
VQGRAEQNRSGSKTEASTRRRDPPPPIACRSLYWGHAERTNASAMEPWTPQQSSLHRKLQTDREAVCTPRAMPRSMPHRTIGAPHFLQLFSSDSDLGCLSVFSSADPSACYPPARLWQRSGSQRRRGAGNRNRTRDGTRAREDRVLGVGNRLRSHGLRHCRQGAAEPLGWGGGGGRVMIGLRAKVRMMTRRG